MTHPRPYTFDRVVRLIITLAIIVGCGLLINRLSAVLLPFVVAWFIAYLIYPMVKFFQYKLRFKFRILSVIAALLTVAVFIGLGIFLLQVPIHNELQRMSKLSELLMNRPIGLDLPQEWREHIQHFLEELDFSQLLQLETLEALAKRLLPSAWSLVSASFSLIAKLAVLFFVLLYLIFILIDYERLSEGWIQLIPVRYRSFASELVQDVQDGMNAYFRGQGLIAACVGVLFAIGFKLINLPLGISFGLLVGLLNLVPYLQTISIPFALLLGAAKSVEMDQNLWMVFLSIAVVYVVVQSIQDLLLTPKIMGKATGLKPAIILLSLSIFGSLFGIIGMIIALPATTLFISYYKRFVIARESFAVAAEDDDDNVEENQA